MNASALAIFGLPGGMEWIIIGVVALLIFGRRLPDVARSVGKSIVEFKKGLKDVKNEIDVQSQVEPPPRIEHKPEPKPTPPPVSEPKAETPPKQEQTPAPSES
jgi:sec-independent protein translocase protein TatA